MAALLEDAPIYFLSVAAKVVSAWAEQAPRLIAALLEEENPELHGLAVALCWLGSPRPGEPLVDPDLIDGMSSRPMVPWWLLHLDQAEVVSAYRRRLPPPFESVAAYLIDVQFIDERIGTIHIEIDHELDGALVHVCLPPLPTYEVRRLTTALDRKRTGRDRPRPYRPIKPVTATRALAAAFKARESVDPPLDLDDQWPLLWPLIFFVTYGLADNRPAS